MSMLLEHENYKCPKCGSHELELHDTGETPIPANDVPISFELTAKTSCTKCGFTYQLMDFCAD